MSDQQIYELYRQLEYNYLSQGTIIFRQDDKGENFYLILKGEVIVMIKFQISEECPSEVQNDNIRGNIKIQINFRAPSTADPDHPE